ncbi:MAG: hypothetical protein EKK47_10375 [Burkholderiales bacterium]|nr:MAG: hypothetical protein EKK47_10375 [Burkholderiales bacterium]
MEHLDATKAPAGTRNLLDTPIGKRLATAKARTALWGGTLTEIDTDDGRPQFIVSRWALCKAFDSIDGVEAFLDRVEGAKA